MPSLLRLHPRLLIAIFIGAASFLLLRGERGPLHASVLAWNAGCWSWIAMMATMMARQHARVLRSRAAEEDIGAWFALAFVCLAAGVSMVAVVFELASARGEPGVTGALHYLLAISTVAASWFAVGFAFSSHYAHLYYSTGSGRPPLRFPDEATEPGYWDFAYFAFTIAVAAQTSDVCVMTSDMRKVVAAQSVLGFVFNAAIIGFSINMFAGALAH